MKSQEAAKIFRDIARMLELKGDNPFRIRAYARAADAVEELGQELEGLAGQDKLTDIPGIGVDLAAKIKEIIATGDSGYCRELREKVPQGLLRMLDIPGLGPKTVKAIYEQLKIETVDELEKAAKAGRLRGVEGIKEKTEENILRGIAIARKGGERKLISLSADTAAEFITALRQMKEVCDIAAAGSLRRRKDTIRDVDILVAAQHHAVVMDRFVSLPQVTQVLAKGGTKASVLAGEDRMQVDLRVVDKDSFGAALMYFTGSKEFNIKMRQLALKKGYKLNEYGLFKGEKNLASQTEAEMFSLLGMEFVAPELREDRGEVEAALENKLPVLVELENIKGDFHVHSNFSDGTATLEQIVQRAQQLKYEHIVITDHSQSLKIANGMDAAAVDRKIREIEALRRKYPELKILCGTEVDILPDGELDYPDDVLSRFDFVIAAVHTAFKQPPAAMTRRLIAACANKRVNVLAHPTGRFWGGREAYEFDLDAVFKAAADCKVAMEINSHPKRLDLNDVNAMKAKKMGVMLALGTDSHKLEQLDNMRFSLDVARRAWLSKNDLLNCLSFAKLEKWLEK